MSNASSHLHRLQELVAHFEQQPSSLGRDLLLQELRAFYETVMQSGATMAQPAPVVDTKAAQAPVAVPSREAAPAVEAVVPPQTTEPVAEVELAETHIAEIALEPVEVAPKDPVAETPVATAVVEMAAPAQVRVNAHIGVKEAERPNDEAILAGKLNRKPISDLRSGIPLNEKFGIIRNLFAGNASDFGDAVLKLNNSRSSEELKHYFLLLTQRRNWDMDSESYQLFLSYVERRAGSMAGSDPDPDQ